MFLLECLSEDIQLLLCLLLLLRPQSILAHSIYFLIHLLLGERRYTQLCVFLLVLIEALELLVLRLYICESINKCRLVVGGVS